MNFIDYGDNRTSSIDFISRVHKSKIFKRIYLITLILSLVIPLIYMVLLIFFKWDISKFSFDVWVNGKVDFKSWLLTTLILSVCSYLIQTVLYVALMAIIYFVNECHQVIYIVLHICSIILPMLFFTPNWYLDSNNSASLRSELGLKILSGFVVWAFVQYFTRILIFPFIRGCFQNNKSKVCSIITILGIGAIIFGGKVFDFSSIATEFDLTSDIEVQILCACLFLVFMAYVHAWTCFTYETLEVHKKLGFLFLIIMTIGLAIFFTSRTKYVDKDGNEYY